MSEEALVTNKLVPTEIIDQGYLNTSKIELSILTLFTFLLLAWQNTFLGVWEMGESLHAALIEWMWQHETWMQVNLPIDKERVRSVAELAFGWWPSMLSVHWLAPKLAWLSPELALRLPALFFATLNVTALYHLMSIWQKRRIFSLLSIGFLLVMPAFNIGIHHHLTAGGIGTLACSLSLLALLSDGLLPSMFWRSIGYVSLLISACSLGFLGLILPLVARFALFKKEPQLKKQLVCLLPCLLTITFFYWRSWVKRPDLADLWHLYFTLDPLKDSYQYGEWSGFQNLLHLIGFNLFPFGALLPVLALGFKALDRDRQQLGQSFTSESSTIEASNSVNLGLGHALSWFLISAFFTTFLLAPSGGYWGGASLLFAVPVAMASAYYFLDEYTIKHTPILYTFSVILLWLLIDSNLKHEPGLMIAALSDEQVKGLLPELKSWRFGRLLSLLGLLIIIGTHTALFKLSWEKIKQTLLNPPQPQRHIALVLCSAFFALLSILPYLITILPKWVVSSAFVHASFWGHMPFQMKVFLFFLLIGLVSYQLLLLLWLAYAGQRQNRGINRIDLSWGLLLSWLIITPHYIERLPIWRFMKPFLPWIEDSQSKRPKLWMTLVLHVIIIGFLGLTINLIRRGYQKYSEGFVNALKGHLTSSQLFNIRIFTSQRFRLVFVVFIWLSASLVFSQSLFLTSLNSKFSYKEIIQAYEARMKKGESLQLYQVNDIKRSFYLRNLNELTRDEFKESAQSAERQFYMIERNRLSEVNQQFRQATKAHLPILDDRHHELLLASNQILKGEQDQNPIKHAIIKELPQGVVALKEPINFQDTIELVAWRLNPSTPELAFH